MNRIKYAFRHGGVLTLVLIIAVALLSSLVFGWKKQLASASDGIEVLLVDTTVTYGATSVLEDEIQKRTGTVSGVGVIETSEAESYVKTINNYTVFDYILDLCSAKNTEILVVPESFLETALSAPILEPLSFAPKNEKCCIDGVPYALNVTALPITENGIVFESTENVYALLLTGDHTEDAKQYLKSLTGDDYNLYSDR